MAKFHIHFYTTKMEEVLKCGRRAPIINNVKTISRSEALRLAEDKKTRPTVCKICLRKARNVVF